MKGTSDRTKGSKPFTPTSLGYRAKLFLAHFSQRSSLVVIKNAVHFSCMLLFVVFSFLPGVLSAAVQTQYAPLAPLPGANGQPVENTTPSLYIVSLFKLGIGVASGLAVLAIAYGGIKYMMSDVVTNKSDAIAGIKNALLGLLLAISSYLLLNTINPDLTKLSPLLDTSPNPAAPPSAAAQGKFWFKYSDVVYVLGFNEMEYELAYVPKVGNNSVLRTRYPDLVSCTTALGLATGYGTTQGTPTCTKMRQLVNPQPPGYLGYDKPLLPNLTYTETPAVTITYATSALCGSGDNEYGVSANGTPAKIRSNPLRDIFNDCNLGSGTVTHREGFATLAECTDYKQTQQQNGVINLVLGGANNVIVDEDCTYSLQ